MCPEEKGFISDQYQAQVCNMEDSSIAVTE